MVARKKNFTMVLAGHKAAKVRKLNERIKGIESDIKGEQHRLAGLKAARTRIQNV